LKDSGNENPRQDRLRIPKEYTKSMMRAFLQMSIANNYITDMHKAPTIPNGQPEASAMVVFFLLLLHTTEKKVEYCHCFLLCCFPEPRAHRLPPQKPHTIVMCLIIHSSTAPHNAIQTQHIKLPTKSTTCYTPQQKSTAPCTVMAISQKNNLHEFACVAKHTKMP
jgi:hypothetical protein